LSPLQPGHPTSFYRLAAGFTLVNLTPIVVPTRWLSPPAIQFRGRDIWVATFFGFRGTNLFAKFSVSAANGTGTFDDSSKNRKPKFDSRDAFLNAETSEFSSSSLGDFFRFLWLQKTSNLWGLGKEGLDVSVLVERRPCLPDPKQNADPTICKFA
jgi:hypothetical protein